MEKNAARQLIEDTFQNPFDKGHFVYFTKELLNHVEEAPFVYRGNYIPDAYKDYINTAERVGKFEDADKNKIDILIVRLKKESSLDQARTMQRNFVAWYLNGSRGGDLKEAALVAFVSPNEEDWRFSLVKMDYQIDNSRDRVRVRQEFTPARRFSFLVGAHENSHTAQSRLVPILENESINPTLKELEESFNIERVTKEFFERYRELFHKLEESLTEILEKDEKIKRDFHQKNISTIDFAKKLLGQIVFLYFLQKKGWFGVGRDKEWGTGNKNFLRALFKKELADYGNFFNEILEPLFYEALATERADDFYSRFNCKIPFLNGGLFDPINNYDWIHTDIFLPNEIFSNDYKTKQGDTGTGILDIFDRYNFTVKEDEPLEKEVAVDPEMLGKVFENLLEVKDRKSKGTYYTPREIVHYMCEQSLANYLASEVDDKVTKEDIEQLIKYGETVVEHDSRVAVNGKETKTYSYKLPESVRKNAELIDKKLEDIRICDPAVGSGAFPVGMMNEIVRTRNALTSYIKNKKNRTIYDFKRHAIQNSLYGVDIDLGAVEIAKLRLWLSLVVDEADRKTIQPLPNLDYKIMQGNSLLEEFEGIKLFDEKLFTIVNVSKEKQIEGIKQKQSILQKEYFELHSKNKLTSVKQAELNIKLKELLFQLKKINKEKVVSEKAGLFDKYSDAKKKADDLRCLHKEFFEATEKSKKDIIKKQIERLEWELIETTLKEQNKISSLKKLEEFKQSNVKPFFLWRLNFSDVFDGRDGFDIIIANPPYIGEKGNRGIFREIKQGMLCDFYQRKMDIFYFFFHLALNIGKNNSNIAFITTNYYLTATAGKNLREDIKNRAIISNLINFNELKIFDSARGQHSLITILQKEIDKNILAKTCVVNRKGNATPEILRRILEGKDTKTIYYKIPQNNLYDGEECYIRLTGQGATTTDPIQLILEKVKNQGRQLDNLCNINQGLLTGIDRTTQRHKINNLVKDASEINKGVFVLSEKEVKILNLTNEEKKILYPFYKNSDIGKYYCSDVINRYVVYATRDLNIEEYPNIYKHLNRFKKAINARSQERGEMQAALKLGKWWVIFAARNKNIFLGEKIISPQRSYENKFAYNYNEWFASADVYFITKKDEDVDLKYILALLNSKLYFLWFYHRGKRKGEMLELLFAPLSEVPIKKIEPSQQRLFVELVDNIIKITKQNDYLQSSGKQARVHNYEKEIDQLVYKLYGLTKEEIKIIELNGK